MGSGEMEMEKWNQDEKEMETSAEEKWKPAPTRNENNCLKSVTGAKFDHISGIIFE